MSFPQVLLNRLRQSEVTGTLRVLKSRQGIDFCSNDYLDFASDLELRRNIVERLVDTPTGATGSRLVRGQHHLFEETERLLAHFSGREAALLYPSGYQANLGLLSALLRPGDMVFSDEKNHASIIDGIRLSRAEVRVYPHLDLGALRGMLQAEKDRPGLKIIVTESLFSMDGDLAPLAELTALAEEFSVQLVVDEAHATGLWGSGFVEYLGFTSLVFATIHTGGKALGCAGAWIACDADLKRYLINFSRPFIFSTAPMPLLAAALSEAIKYWNIVGRERAKTVHEKSAQLRMLLGARGISSKVTGPIFPIILSSNDQALRVSQVLDEQGFDVRAIRPPTVPERTARLRITIRSQTEVADLERLALVLNALLENDR